MRRWNGWGDTSVIYPLPAKAEPFLKTLVGASKPPQAAQKESVLKAIPASRLPAHPLVSTAAEERLCHARGQSLPDWIALRSGRIPVFPDGVAYPQDAAEVQTLLDYAADVGAKLIPYGGGTSVVGHINPQPGDAPVLTMDMRRLNQLQAFDQASQLATFGAGVSGPELEAQLRARGFTLGHFPQSFEFSTLGGWIVTRSSGQQSLHYGRIENLFAGGTIISPAGRLILPNLPASAAGPSIHQMILGSEGRMGIVTAATVRVSPLPQAEDFHAVFFPDFDSGKTAVRQIVQAGLPCSMLRMSTAVETETTLALAGHERLLNILDQYLSLRNVRAEKCMLLLGFSGDEALVKTTRKRALDICSDNRGIHVGKQFGKQWHKGRFRTPYLRNTLWEKGYAIDTLETAVSWSKIDTTLAAIETALHDGLTAIDERVHVFTHLSHMYPQGASIYTTYLYRLATDPEENLRRWQILKTAASQAIVNHGGTISHQHGVGSDHAPYLQAEKGVLGMAVLGDVVKRFDPQGTMNPGKLLL